MFLTLFFVDYVLLPFLVLLVVFAILRERTWLRVSVILILLFTIFVSEVSLEPVVRAVVSHRHRTGQWTSEFTAGVLEMAAAVADYRPYVLVSALGLAIIAFPKRRAAGSPPQS
jgi:hypothetical protein